MAIQLYSWPRSSGTRVAWALEELGVPYEYVQLDPKKGEHKATSFLKINPQGKVPALTDGERTFFESAAILLHLGDTYGVAKALWPSGGPERDDALCWTVWANADLGPYLLQFVYHGLDSPISFKPADRSAAAAAYSRSQLENCLHALDARLQGREHLLGAFSLVDVAVASWLRMGSMLGVTLEDHAPSSAWLQRCLERPALARAK
jgi:glutathione S-transferase